MRRPPVKLEVVPNPWGGRGPTAEVNRYALNPLLDFLKATMSRPSLSTEPAPTMFSAGDLPIFTASGVDVDVLRWCHWSVRHSAAMTANAAHVWQMIEDPDNERWQSSDGTLALQEYAARMWKWAVTPAPIEVAAITDSEYEEFWRS